MIAQILTPTLVSLGFVVLGLGWWFLKPRCPSCKRRNTLRYRGFYFAGEFIADLAKCRACGARFDVEGGTNSIVGPVGTKAKLEAQHAARMAWFDVESKSGVPSAGETPQ